MVTMQSEENQTNQNEKGPCHCHSDEEHCHFHCHDDEEHCHCHSDIEHCHCHDDSCHSHHNENVTADDIQEEEDETDPDQVHSPLPDYETRHEEEQKRIKSKKREIVLDSNVKCYGNEDYGSIRITKAILHTHLRQVIFHQNRDGSDVKSSKNI